MKRILIIAVCAVAAMWWLAELAAKGRGGGGRGGGGRGGGGRGGNIGGGSIGGGGGGGGNFSPGGGGIQHTPSLNPGSGAGNRISKPDIGDGIKLPGNVQRPADLPQVK